MNQKNEQKSSINRIREKLYREVEQNEKTERLRVYYFCTVAIAILLIASILFFVAAFIESRADEKYVYYFDGEEEKIDLSLAFDGDIQYIDVCSLAKHLKIVQTKLSETEITFSINGTSATFQNEQTKATVNDFQIEMPAKAVIKNDYCLIPLSTVREIFHGIHILAQQEHTNVSSTESKIYIITTDEMEIEYITNVSEYLSYIHSNDPYIYTLANKDKTLGANFPPDLDLLIEIPEKYRKPSPIFLYYVAEYALEAMMQDMFALGYDDVYVTSAYRSYAKQEQIFNGYVQELLNKNHGMTEEEAKAIVSEDTALPGKSEHQTGLCVDFTTTSILTVDNRFAETEVYHWLIENAWKYGFVLRYPEDKYDIVQYKYESWHFRFVGFNVASIMHQTGLCYEEYLEFFDNK